ncbi:hypothetical protein McanMca71_004662 [Microsporum canis]
MAVAKRAQEGTPAKGDHKLIPNSRDRYAPSPYNKASETDIDMLLAEGKAAAVSSYAAGTSKPENAAHKSLHDIPSNNGSITIRGTASMPRGDNKSKATGSPSNPSIPDAPIRNDTNNRMPIPLPQKPLEPRKPCSPGQARLQHNSPMEAEFSPNYHQLTPLTSPSQRPEALIEGGMTPTSVTPPNALPSKCMTEHEFQNLEPQGLQDLRSWLLFTGYYDEDYRQKTISRHRRLVALDEERAELIREEQYERQAFADRSNIGLPSPSFSHMVIAGTRNTTPCSSSALLSHSEPQGNGSARRASTPTTELSKIENENTHKNKESQQKIVRPDGQAIPNDPKSQGARDRQPNNNYPSSLCGGRRVRASKRLEIDDNQGERQPGIKYARHQIPDTEFKTYELAHIPPVGFSLRSSTTLDTSYFLPEVTIDTYYLVRSIGATGEKKVQTIPDATT